VSPEKTLTRTLNINVLANYFLPIMLDYTLIASKLSTRLLTYTLHIVCLCHNDSAFFDSNLAVNCITFGSQCRKLVGNPGGSLDINTLQHAAGCEFCMYHLLYFCKFLANPNINLELDCIFRKPMKHRFQRHTVRTEIFSIFHAQVDTFL